LDPNGTLQPAAKRGFDRRLARYALAGSALLAVPAAQAGVVNSGAVDFTVTAANSAHGIDFNGDIVNDISLNVQGSPSTHWVYLSGPGTTFVNVGPLSGGFTITSANTTSALNQDLFKDPSGPWVSTTHGFVGVKFNISGQQHLGFLELTLDKDTPTVTLNSYAYETVVGASITTTPEPSSLALFAAGAAGILALRRRRNRPA
jgi:hypothetical protein